MGDRFDELAADEPLSVAEVFTRLGKYPTIGPDVVGSLQLVRKLGLQEPPGVLGRTLKVVTGRLVHGVAALLSFGLEAI
jgi:hypothetical protein